MARNNKNDVVQKVSGKFSSAEHRHNYKTKFYNLISEKLENHNSVNSRIVCETILYLENFGIYTHYEFDNYYKSILQNKKYFIDKLDIFLQDEQNRLKVYKAIILAYKSLNNIKSYSFNTYYRDFYDDIEALLGFRVSPEYFNFVEPAIYKGDIIDDPTLQYNLDKIVNNNIAESNLNEKIKRNQAINKKVVENYKLKKVGASNV